MTVKETLELFCKNTSLRGVAKTLKAPTRLLRRTWTLYVLLMLVALITCVTLIAKDYLEYNTTIQTTLLINDETLHHPALTMCSHYPFSEKAHSLWANGSVLSPTNFSRMIRRNAWAAFNDSDLGIAQLIASNDRKRIYYQSLQYSDAVRISVSADQLFIFCVYGNGTEMKIGESSDCGLIIKKISLPSFFNCFQVQANTELEWLTLILHVVKSQQSQYEEAFVHDIFEQAHGIRLQMHENNTYPDPSAKGIHIEPGKLIEINYNHIRWHEAGTPGDRCLSLKEVEAYRLHDLDQTFAYSFDGCIKEQVGMYVLRKCRCYFADYMRQNWPNSSHPYCGDARLSPARTRHYVECLSEINFSELKVKLSQTLCPKRCSFSEYKTFASQTVWKSTKWQIHWLLKQSRSLTQLIQEQHYLEAANSEFEEQEISVKSQEAKQKLIEVFSATNLTKVNFSRSGSLLDHTGDFAYVTIKKRTRNTLQKTETLSLSISALMSRVGGLCSLFLGLTCAFVVEVLEILLLCCSKSSKQHQAQLEPAESAVGDGGQQEVEGESAAKRDAEVLQTTDC